MTRVLVTGATGTIGSRVVAELRRREVPVRAFARDAGRAAETLGSGVEVAAGDFADPASIRGALEGADRVLLSSGNHPRQAEYVIDAAAPPGCAGSSRSPPWGRGSARRWPSPTGTPAASAIWETSASRRSSCARASSCRTCSPRSMRSGPPAGCSPPPAPPGSR